MIPRSDVPPALVIYQEHPHRACIQANTPGAGTCEGLSTEMGASPWHPQCGSFPGCDTCFRVPRDQGGCAVLVPAGSMVASELMSPWGHKAHVTALLPCSSEHLWPQMCCSALEGFEAASNAFLIPAYRQSLSELVFPASLSATLSAQPRDRKISASDL